VRIRDVASGIAAGYFTRGIQLLATLLLVPFLLADDILGVDGYGEVFTLLAFASVLSLLTDGLRVSFSRSISLSIAREPHLTASLLGSAVKLNSGIGFVFLGGILLFSNSLLDALGIALTEHNEHALLLAGAVAFAETVPFAFESYLLARGRMVFLNGIRAAEVVVRTLGLFVVLSGAEASTRSYLLVLFLTIFFRQACIAGYVLYRWSSELAGLIRAPLSDALATVHYSLAVSGSSFSFYALTRFTIILANRFLGSTESGYLALVLNTLDRYVSELLFSVLRPILIPVASMLHPRTLSESGRLWLLRAVALYTSLMLVAIFSIVTLLPLVVPLWLGSDFQLLILPMQAVLIGTAARLATSLKHSMLIAHGQAPRLAVISFLTLIPAVLAILWGVLGLRSWSAIAFAVSGYHVIAGIVGVVGGFDRLLDRSGTPESRPTLRFLAMLAGMTGVALSASYLLGDLLAESRWPSAALVWLLTVGIFLAITDRLSIRISEALRTLRKLRDDSHRELKGAHQ
jgi:hypothetical protein